MGKRRRPRSRRRNSGRISVTIMVVILLAVMSVQIYRLKQKDATYAAQEQALQKDYEEETERASEIESLADYMKSTQYIEDIAKSKLGLAYDDEIIFKQKED